MTGPGIVAVGGGSDCYRGHGVVVVTVRVIYGVVVVVDSCFRVPDGFC